MLTLMRAHVNQFGRSAHGVHSSLNNALRLGDEGDYRAVVIGIDMRVEHAGRVDGRDRFGNGLNGFGLAAFAEVRNTLDQALHESHIKTGLSKNSSLSPT